MNPLLYMLAPILIFAIIFLLWNFPWLTKYYRPKVCRITTDCKKILVASDFHLTPGRVMPSKLIAAIRKEKVDCVVFLGDVLDCRKKVTDSTLRELLENAFDGLLEIEDLKDLYYTMSTSSHDPKIDGLIVLELGKIKTFICPGILILETNNGKFYFAHGDYACRHGTVARILNKIMAILGRKMFTEKLAKRAYKVPREYWLFVGHTHMVGIDQNHKVANPGSWKSKIGVSSSETYIIIEDGRIYLSD